MTDVPAGWYPDPTPPTAAPGLRYWDGGAWTAHVAPGAPQTGTPQPAYAAPAGPTTAGGQPLAGWGHRLAAYLIDAVPIGMVSMIASIPVQLSTQDESRRLSDQLAETGDFGAFWTGQLDQMRASLLWQLPLIVLMAVYFIAMLRWKGATVGKLAVGLQVRLAERPGQLPWSAVLLRVAAFNGVGLLPIVAVFTGSWVLIIVVWLALSIYVFLDVLWPLWDDRRQALHDKAARTNVVKVR